MSLPKLMGAPGVGLLGVLALAVVTPTAGLTQTVGRHVDRTPLWQRVDHDILWNFHNMYNLHIVQVPGDEYPYRGWFFGWAWTDANPGFPGCDAIFAARSRDLLSGWQVWTRSGELAVGSWQLAVGGWQLAVGGRARFRKSGAGISHRLGFW